MINLQQNKIQNEIEKFNKGINLVQDKLKKFKNEKRGISKMQNGSKKIAKRNKIHKEKSKLKGR